MHTRRLHPDRRMVLRALAVGSIALLPGMRVRRVRASESHPDPPPGVVAEPEPPCTVDCPVPLLIPEDIGADEAWVAVNLTAQAAVAMRGREPTHTALVTTGRPGWDTPQGEFRIVRRVANETMTSAALNITDPDEQYVLTDVLYTQYFTWVGHALHLNYWQPDGVFGHERTSHGCVGMRLADAESFWRHLELGARVVIHG